jgi:hypothetical protein
VRLTATRIDADQLARTTHELEQLVGQRLDEQASQLMMALATSPARAVPEPDVHDFAEVHGGTHGAP